MIWSGMVKMRAPKIPMSMPKISREFGIFPNLKNWRTQKRTLLVLVKRAFTGPRGPTEEALTMATPPNVLRMLLIVPITR